VNNGAYTSSPGVMSGADRQLESAETLQINRQLGADWRGEDRKR